MPHHYSPWGSPLISWQFNIKKYKLIISTGSACLLLCNVNRGSTLNADGVQAEPLTVTKYLSGMTAGMQGTVPRSNYTEWVIILALGIMFQWQWRSCWFNAIRQVRLRGSRARLSFWEFIWHSGEEKPLLKSHNWYEENEGRKEVACIKTRKKE